MMLILQNHRVILSGRKTAFSAVQGVAPYTYSVAAGGVGGTIDSDGRYVAPSGIVDGMDTIIAEDSLGDQVQTEIAVMGLPELVCEIIQSELELAVGQVRLYNQKLPVPKELGLLIALRLGNSKPFGSSKSMDGSGANLVQIQTLNMMTSIDLDIMSRDTSALNRKEEVLLALSSDYAQTQMEANGFKLGKLSGNFVNLSQEEGAAIPYRFNISVNMLYAITKEKNIKYFDTFTASQILTND